MSSTIIKSLIVKLGLDSSSFTSDLDKVRDELSNIGADVGKININLDRVANSGKKAVQFLAAIGSSMAIRRFAEDVIASSAALDRFSKNRGLSTESVAAWGNAIEAAGGSASGLQSTMAMLVKEQGNLVLHGDSSLIRYFSSLGMAMVDARGKALPVGDQLLKLADRFGSMDKMRAISMGTAMGIDEGTMNLLLKGRKEVEVLIKRQEEYAAVQKKFAPVANAINVSMNEARQQFYLLGLMLVQHAAPAIGKVFSLFSDFGKWARENEETITPFFVSLAGGLGLITASAIPISGVAVAIGGLAAAIATLWQDYKVWREGGDSLIPWDKWAPDINNAIEGIRRVKDAIGDLMYRAIGVGDLIGGLATGDTNQVERALTAIKEGSPATSGGKSQASRSLDLSMKSAHAAPGGMKMARSSVSPSAAGIENPQEMFARLEKKYGLRPGWLDRTWAAESSRGENMLSPAGAMGHFGLMPKTAARYGVKDPNNLAEAADGAARYQVDLLKASKGDQRLAAIYYNWGMGNYAKKGEAGLPRETRNYVNKVVQGVPNASMFSPGAGAAAPVNPTAGSRTGGSVETNIGNVNVYTNESSAAGIARDIKKTLDYTFAAQSNYGLT